MTSNQASNLEAYRLMMSRAHASGELKGRVLAQAARERKAVEASRANGPRERQAAPVPSSRARLVGGTLAACLVLASGIGLGLTLPGSPFQATATLADTVAVNSFALAAYAAEFPDEVTGKAIELDQSRFKGVGGYSGAWYDPATGTFTDNSWAGYKFGLNLTCTGENVQSITYEIEGERAYIELMDGTAFAASTAEGESEDADGSIRYMKTFTTSYEDQWNLPGTNPSGNLRPDGLIASLYVGFPLSDDAIANYNALIAGERTDERHKALDTAIETGAAQEISRCTLTATATFADGTTQTKRYRIEPMADFAERYSAYWDALNAFRATAGDPSSNASPEEFQERYNARPAEPRLYTITEAAKA